MIDRWNTGEMPGEIVSEIEGEMAQSLGDGISGKWQADEIKKN